DQNQPPARTARATAKSAISLRHEDHSAFTSIMLGTGRGKRRTRPRGDPARKQLPGESNRGESEQLMCREREAWRLPGCRREFAGGGGHDFSSNVGRVGRFNMVQ